MGVRRVASGTRRRVGERSEPSQTRLRACVCTRMQGKISCIARKIRGVQEISTEIAVRYYCTALSRILKPIVIVKIGASNRISIDITSMLTTINHSVCIRFILPSQTINTFSFYHHQNISSLNSIVLISSIVCNTSISGCFILIAIVLRKASVSANICLGV